MAGVVGRFTPGRYRLKVLSVMGRSRGITCVAIAAKRLGPPRRVCRCSNSIRAPRRDVPAQGLSKKLPSPVLARGSSESSLTINPPPVYYHEFPPAYDQKNRDPA